MKKIVVIILSVAMCLCVVGAYAFTFDELEKMLNNRDVEVTTQEPTSERATSYEGRIAAGQNITVAIDDQGQLLVAGSAKYRKEIATWQGIVRVRNSLNALIGFCADGTVKCCGYGLWGYDFNADLSVMMKRGAITDAAAGGYHSAAILSDGSLVSRGNSTYSAGNTGASKNAVKVTASSNGFTAALLPDGSVRINSSNTSLSQRYHANEWQNMVDVEFGDLVLVGLKNDGTIMMTSFSRDPDERFAQAASWTDIAAISVNQQQLLGLKKDGTVVSCGENACDVSEWCDIVAVAAGRSHAVGLRSDGTLVVAGIDDDSHQDVSNWKLW